MTKPEFVVKWRERLCWLGLRGLAFDNEERAKGPFKSAEYALNMPDRIEKMLAELWDDLNPPPKSTKLNGG